MAKSKYETHVLPYLDRIEWWLKMGATQEEVAEKLHITSRSLREYLLKGENGEARFVPFFQTFMCAREVADDEVEAALFKRAKGIEYEEKTYKTVINEVTGEYEEICEKRVTKYIPPDPTSAMFWLTNRRPDRWKYKPAEVEGNESETGVVMIPEVSAIE